MAKCRYVYNGTGDPRLPSNWIRATSKPACETGGVLCAIYAPACGAQPTSPFSGNLKKYIGDALASFVPEPQLPMTTKKYVYLKSE